MDFLDWRILIGIAVFIAGWMLARVDMQQVITVARSIPNKVSEGVALLLNNDKIAAASTFLEAATPLDRSNTELHFIAGSLYRSAGDHETAIRVHKNILANAELNDVHNRARYELGLDYQVAGFVDLAIQSFSQLVGTEYGDRSVRHLFDLHLYSRDWSKAINNEQQVANKDKTTELRRHLIAQIYCEWASEEKDARKIELLDEALKRNPNCGRALIMLAQEQLQNKDPKTALATLSKIQSQKYLLPITVDILLEAHKQVGSLEIGIKTLTDEFKQSPTLILFAKIYDAFAKHVNAEQLSEFVGLGLTELPQALTVSRWLDVARKDTDNSQRDNFDRLYSALGMQNAKFRCYECDFESRTHHWQCPACRKWETMLDKPQASSLTLDE